MINKKYMIFIIIMIVALCSITAISASDNNTTDSGILSDVNSELVTINEDNASVQISNNESCVNSSNVTSISNNITSNGTFHSPDENNNFEVTVEYCPTGSCHWILDNSSFGVELINTYYVPNHNDTAIVGGSGVLHFVFHIDSYMHIFKLNLVDYARNTIKSMYFERSISLFDPFINMTRHRVNSSNVIPIQNETKSFNSYVINKSINSNLSSIKSNETVKTIDKAIEDIIEKHPILSMGCCGWLWGIYKLINKLKK